MALLAGGMTLGGGLAGVGAASPGAPGPVVAFTVTDDEIATPLGGFVGDPGRGLAIVLDRAKGNCLICHAVPVPAEPFQGELGPDLAGVGGRLREGQIRLRLVDQSRLDPGTLMPPYYRVDGLTRVAGAYEGRPVLSAQEVEDVVAWLTSLKPAQEGR